MQAQARAEDLRFATERRLICKGSARVRFECLKWNEYIKRNPEKLKPDPKHVKRIKQILKRPGCRPMEVGHHILAVVDQQQLDAALEDARQKNRWNMDTLPSHCAAINTPDGYPELEFPAGIECLRGRHRIEAAKDLPEIEKWWIVDLYLSTISYEHKTFLIEKYPSGKRPRDGEIYRKIRDYQILSSSVDSMISPATCVSLEKIWWSLFSSENRRDKLDNFLSENKSLHGDFRDKKFGLKARFDSIMKIPGLFDDGMMVTVLHKITAMGCPEELGCALDEITTCWNSLLHGIVGGHQRIDSVTVREVELMAPGVSTRDAQDLCGKVQFGSIFSAFSPQERTIIWENMLAYKSIISSLSKFFQDVLLLQACVNGVKRLFMVDPTETVLSALKRAFRAHDSKRSQLVQTTEDSFQTETGDSISCMMLGYLGMFAYFLRHYEDVPAEPTRKNAKTIPRPKADLGVLQRSAIFADQIGFESEKIKSLKGDLPHIPVRIAQGPVPILVTTGPGVSKKKRCGFPGENFKEDKQYLFLHNLFADKVETGEGITSFFVLKCWFISFFGWTRKPTSKECLKAPPQPPPPPPPPTQLVDGGDVAMGEAQPAPNQQVQDLPVDTDEKMQETTQLTQERMSGPAIEANQGIEEEDTLFVPTEPPPQTQTTEAVNKKIIRFVELTGNESDMSDPLQAPLGVKRPVQLVEVEDGDPNSRVAQQVHEYFLKGKRVCDKHKKYILGEECYAVATEKENQNTLFVIPNAELQGDVKGKVSETSEWGAQAMTGLRDHKAGQEITQEPERERQLTEGGEDHTTPQPNQEDEALLGSEQENAANAHILGETIIIHLKRLADSHDVMKPDKDWVWEDMEPMIVPIGDPQELVKQKLGQYRHEMHLRPYDGNHKALEYGDCYKVAAKAEDHALYMLPEALPWHTLPPALHWHEESKRGRLYEPPRMQEETNWKNSTFAPQLDVPLLPPQQKPVVSAPEVHWNILPLPPEPEPKPEQLVGSIMGVHKPSDELAKFIAEVSSPPRSSRQKLVKSTIEAAPPLPPPSKQQPPLVRSSKEKHRDKLAGERENKVGLSFQAEEIGIRKKPDKMRVTQESEDDPPEKSSQDRKYAKARNPRSGGTGMVLDSKVTEGGVDHDMGEALGSGTLEGDGEIL